MPLQFDMQDRLFMSAVKSYAQQSHRVNVLEAERDEALRDRDEAIEEEVDQQTRSIRDALMDAMHDHAATLDRECVGCCLAVGGALRQETLSAANADCAILRALLAETRRVADWVPPELAAQIKRALGEE